jgi:methyl-accepting chemotaxis protein
VIKVRTYENLITFNFLGGRLSPKGMLLIMLLFGIATGLVFPAFIVPFVSFKTRLHFFAFWFICILAGIIVSYLYYKLSIYFGVQLIKNATQIAEKSLGKNFLETTTTTADIDIAAEKFSNLLDYTHLLVGQIKDSAKALKIIGDELVKISSSNAASSNQLAASITEISATIEEIARTAANITSNTEILALNAKRTLEEASEGKQTVSSAYEAFKAVKEINDNLVASVTEIAAKIGAINDVVNFIEEISAKTKILALNASIEAARAGEKGKGFSVVASEIRGLTERVSDYTTNIKSVTLEIQDLAATLEKLIEESKKKFDELSVKSNETLKKLTIIEAAARETSNSSESILSAVEQEKSATKQISLSMRELQQAAQNLVKITSSLMEVASNLEQQMNSLVNVL